MRISLYIDCDNAAFGEHAGSEIAAILRRIADDVDGNGTPEVVDRQQGMPVRDSNGNTVGKVRVDEGVLS